MHLLCCAWFLSLALVDCWTIVPWPDPFVTYLCNVWATTTKRQLLVPNRVVFLPSQLWNWLNFCVWAWARTSVQILNGAQKDQVILHNVMTFTVNQTRVYTKNHAWNTGYQAVLTNFLSKLFFVHLLYLGLDHLIKTKNWAITTSNLSKQNQIFIKYFIYSISTNIVKEEDGWWKNQYYLGTGEIDMRCLWHSQYGNRLLSCSLSGSLFSGNKNLVELVKMPAKDDDLRMKLDSGQVDVVAGVPVGVKALLGLAFSQPYYFDG